MSVITFTRHDTKDTKSNARFAANRSHVQVITDDIGPFASYMLGRNAAERLANFDALGALFDPLLKTVQEWIDANERHYIDGSNGTITVINPHFLQPFICSLQICGLIAQDFFCVHYSATYI